VHCLRPLLIGLTLTLLPFLARSSAAREGAVRRSLLEKAQANGSVRVIAKLALTPPESTASEPETAARFSGDDIAKAQSELGDELELHAWRFTRRFKTIPFVALEVGPDALGALESSPNVTAVEEDRLARPTLDVSGPLIGADQAWAQGFDGTGWTIAIIDTGVDRNHPFLTGKVVDEACFSQNGNCPNGQTEQLGEGSAAPCTYAVEGCTHGTHVAGIAAGRGTAFSGIGRGANLIALQVFSRFTGRDDCGNGEDPCTQTFTSDQIAGLERSFELRNTFQIAAVNMSLGGGEFSSQSACDVSNAARKAAIDNLRSVGIATVIAAGNEFLTDALDAPACISSAVSVGATTKSDTVISFSNSATFLSLLAPGVSILSSVPGGGFERMSGTSQATPHVAGAWAILKQHSPTASVDAVLSALQVSGKPITDPRNGITKSRIDVVQALAQLPASTPQSGLQITPDGKRTLVSKDIQGQRWAITLNSDDSTVTGNVFSPGGGDPQFVWCEKLFDDGNANPSAVQITFACSGADRCLGAPCSPSAWAPIAQVTLPGSFFLPPDGTASTTSDRLAAVDTAAPLATASGLQITPDLKRTLVSKDISSERWAITYNADDNTVTGNVFSSSGGDPQFVWCERLSDDGNPDPAARQITFACSGADRCTAGPCSPSAWAPIAQVTLPGSFFLPPNP
jgi:subtilisin family serine protease